MESDVALREASDDDAAALAGLFRRTRARAMPYLNVAHAPSEDRTYFERVLAERDVWVAETPERIVGFIAFTPRTIDHLYVDEDERGAGVGSTLLAWALRDGGARELWTFARNARAIAFYEARGFAIVERTDGAGNEEREPDVRMRREAGPPGE